jgi:hypothetical protein
MLAQNFKSAADLGITEPQKEALMKTLVLLETGKLRHVPYEAILGMPRGKESRFAGLFNMGHVSRDTDCGSICCIKGTAQLISGVSLNAYGNPALFELFFTDRMNNCDLTPDQAATALRSYLTTGDARWDLAVA